MIGSDKATALKAAKRTHIHRIARKNKPHWVVIIGSGPVRHYRCFWDSEYGGTEQALEAATLYRDQAWLQYQKEHRTRRKRTPSDSRSMQLRIRMFPEETAAMERRRIQDWNAGHPYAENLSEWLRHQIQPLLLCSPGKESCFVSAELYSRVEELACRINKPPEQIVEECIWGIIGLIDCPRMKRSPIITAWRCSAPFPDR